MNVCLLKITTYVKLKLALFKIVDLANFWLLYMLPAVKRKAVLMVNSCYLEVHFKNNGYFHGNTKFYNPYI